MNKSARISLISASLLACVLLSGCLTSTVVPVPVAARGPSFDGNVASSGFVAFATNGVGIITSNGRDTYNALIDLYGKEFVPPLTHDSGVTIGPFVRDVNGYVTTAERAHVKVDVTKADAQLYFITGQRLVNFQTMKAWKRAGKIPK